MIIIAVKQNDARTKAVEKNARLALFVRGKFYWLLQVPFELHLGWIMAAFALNTNVVLVAEKASSTVQVVVAALSLVVLTISSLACLYKVKTPIYTIPCVAIWAAFWIFVELHNPKELIVDTFSTSEVNGFCYGAVGVFFALTYACIHKLFSS